MKQYVEIVGESSFPAKQHAELALSVLAAGKPFRMNVYGNSMLPFLRDGDNVTLSPVKQRVCCGDIVAALHGGEHLVLHRVIALKGDTVVMRGDNTTTADPPVPLSDIIGSVTKVERNGRRVWFGIAGVHCRVVAALSRRGTLRSVVGVIRRMKKRVYSGS